MNQFESVKAAVTPRQAAENYGLAVSRNGMTCCPFHKDRHPSLKLNEDYFFCFGCHASGDVIDFTARLFGISLKDAARKLSADFGISAETKQVFIRQNPSRLDELRCRRALTDYLHLLKEWKTQYAPKTPEDSLDDRFVESCQMEETVNFFLDALIVGDPAPRERVLEVLVKDGSIYELQAYVEKQKKEELSHAGEYQPCA